MHNGKGNSRNSDRSSLAIIVEVIVFADGQRL